MESDIITFIIDTLNQLATNYPDATWIGMVVAGILTICGIASVATIWMPVPKDQSGTYYYVYRVVHALAAHYKHSSGALADAKSTPVQKAVAKVTDKTEAGNSSAR